MRYTTIIDITEIPEVWRNQNIRNLYLYMVLRSGYHDDDRDILRKSVRNLASDTGLTVSAVRHGLQVLQRHGLLVPAAESIYKVTKFVLETKPTKRARTAEQQQNQERARERAIANEERERRQEQERAAYDRSAALAAIERLKHGDGALSKLKSIPNQPKKK